MDGHRWRETCLQLGLRPQVARDADESAIDRGCREITDLAAVPHCFFSHLLSHPLFFPVENPFDDAGRLLAYTPLGVRQGFGPEVEWIRSDVLSLLPFVGAQTSGLVLHADPGRGLCIHGPDWEKMVSLAAGKLEARLEAGDIAIEAGEEIILSPPDPALPDEFLEHLREICARSGTMREVYVFVSTLREAESSLVIGVVPDAEEFSLEPLMMEILGAVQAHVVDQDRVDFLALDDPELLEVVRATVSPVFSQA